MPYLWGRLGAVKPHAPQGAQWSEREAYERGIGFAWGDSWMATQERKRAWAHPYGWRADWNFCSAS
jgi:hypothetical protein